MIIPFTPNMNCCLLCWEIKFELFLLMMQLCFTFGLLKFRAKPEIPKMCNKYLENLSSYITLVL